MSNRPTTPSILTDEILNIAALATATETTKTEQKAEEAPRKVGRPAKTTAKAKPTSFYIHPAVKDVLRDISYHHRCKEHDLFVEGLEHVLKKYNFPSISEIISKAEKS